MAGTGPPPAGRTPRGPAAGRALNAGGAILIRRGEVRLNGGAVPAFWVAVLAVAAVGGVWLARSTAHGFYADYYRLTVWLLGVAAVCLLMAAALLMGRRDRPAPEEPRPDPEPGQDSVPPGSW